MSAITDLMGRIRVSSGRIRERNPGGLDLEAEVLHDKARMGQLTTDDWDRINSTRPDLADSLQQAQQPYRQSIHAAAATERDPLARQRYQSATAQAGQAPAFGAEYGQDALARADQASKTLYGAPAQRPRALDPILKNAGRLAREQEDFASGAFQQRGGPGLDQLAAPNPEPAPSGLDPVPRPNEAVGTLNAYPTHAPTESQMAQAEQSNAMRARARSKIDQIRQQVRNRRLAEEQRRSLDNLARQKGGPEAIGKIFGGQRLASDRGPGPFDPAVRDWRERMQREALEGKQQQQGVAEEGRNNRQANQHAHDVAVLGLKLDNSKDLAKYRGVIQDAMQEKRDAATMRRLIQAQRGQIALKKQGGIMDKVFGSEMDSYLAELAELEQRLGGT